MSYSGVARPWSMRGRFVWALWDVEGAKICKFFICPISPMLNFWVMRGRMPRSPPLGYATDVLQLPREKRENKVSDAENDMLFKMLIKNQNKT